MIYYEINTISVCYFPAKYLKTFFLIIKASLNEKLFFKSLLALFISSLFDWIMNNLKASLLLWKLVWIKFFIRIKATFELLLLDNDKAWISLLIGNNH